MVEMKKNVEKKMTIQREGQLITEKLGKGHQCTAEWGRTETSAYPLLGFQQLCFDSDCRHPIKH